VQDASARKTYWLATPLSDGRPHIAGGCALWVAVTSYFTGGATTRKPRDRVTAPHCVFSVALPDHDLKGEGTARQVTDEPHCSAS
jgi:hypothetical protein